MHRILSDSCLLLFLLLISVPFRCSSYRVGDVVDTIVRTPEESTDALNSQMPLFGVPSSAIFTELPERLSLAFQEGLRPLPWIEMYDHKKRPLKEMTVTFVYSKSGDGTIHAVSSETKYSDARSDSEGFRVKYQWKEEEEVDLQSGAVVMFLAVCIVSIIVLLQSCTGSGFEGIHHHDESSSMPSSYEAYGQPSTFAASGMPKWD